MIPKKIHYCWYGDEIPLKIQKYMATWSVLADYQIIEWNENNCDLEKNDFIKEAVKRKQWAYVSDYFRILALYKEGGIYLDTDVKVLKSFNDLLSYSGFMGYIFDNSIGTAVLGFEKGHSFLKKILDVYKTARWTSDGEIEVYLSGGGYQICQVNNTIFNDLLKKNYKEFILDGKRKSLLDIELFPKEEFELGYIMPNKGYCVHVCEGSWRNMSLRKKMNSIIKNMAGVIPIIHLDIAIRTITYRKYGKK